MLTLEPADVLAVLPADPPLLLPPLPADPLCEPPLLPVAELPPLPDALPSLPPLPPLALPPADVLPVLPLEPGEEEPSETLPPVPLVVLPLEEPDPLSLAEPLKPGEEEPSETLPPVLIEGVDALPPLLELPLLDSLELLPGRNASLIEPEPPDCEPDELPLLELLLPDELPLLLPLPEPPPPQQGQFANTSTRGINRPPARSRPVPSSTTRPPEPVGSAPVVPDRSS